MTKLLDKRDCPKCTTRMEPKAKLFDGFTQKPPELWQCPDCKNVEVIYLYE